MTKPTKWLRPAKTQISLGIRPVWSESSLSAWRKLGSLATHWTHSEESDQTGRMPRLIWVFAGSTVTLLVLSYRGSCYVTLILTLFSVMIWVFSHAHTKDILKIPYMSRLMRLWHLSPSVNSIFKHACAAIHWGYTADVWSDPSSTSILYVREQRRLWRDCADAQSRLSLRCSPMR